MFNAIAKPFGLLLMWLYETVGNYGIAVILFALIVKIILLPFQMRAKRSTMRMSRLQPRMQELQKKHGANRQKLNEEIQKMYREENVKPMSGCIWSMIPFPILIALYQAIRFPLTIMMGVPADTLAEGGAIYNMLQKLNYSTDMNVAYEQIAQAQFISRPENWPFFANLSEKLSQMDYSFLGLDLGTKPQLKILWEGDWSDPSTGKIALLLLIPLLAALLTYLQSKISTKLTNNGDPNDPQQRSAKTMLYMMPLMTLYFAFIMPAALGVYWIAGSVFAIIQELLLNKKYQKIFEKEDAEYNERQRLREAELEAKRKETERLKAENATTRNPNTSKKKMHLTEREEQREKAQEWERKTKHVTDQEAEDPARVGQRRYARGRAYDPSRYEHNGVSAPEPLETEELPVEETVADVQEIKAIPVQTEDVDVIGGETDDGEVDSISAAEPDDSPDDEADDIVGDETDDGENEDEPSEEESAEDAAEEDESDD